MQCSDARLFDVKYPQGILFPDNFMYLIFIASLIFKHLLLYINEYFLWTNNLPDVGKVNYNSALKILVKEESYVNK